MATAQCPRCKRLLRLTLSGEHGALRVVRNKTGDQVWPNHKPSRSSQSSDPNCAESGAIMKGMSA